MQSPNQQGGSNMKTLRAFAAGMIVLTAGLPAGPVRAKEAAEPSWAPFIEMDGQLLPSMVVATATVKTDEDEEQDASLIGDPYGQIGAVVESAPAGAKLKLVVRETRWFAASEESATVEEAGDYSIFPKLGWNYDNLLKARQVEPASVVMELFVNGKSLGTRTETVTVRSLNDCPLYRMPTDENGKPVDSDEGAATEGEGDLSFMFAAYVNENHPWVDQITREALESGVVDSFTGYQSGEEDEVYKQVFAIWNVMQRRGMKYSDITTSSAESQVVLSHTCACSTRPSPPGRPTASTEPCSSRPSCARSTSPRTWCWCPDTCSWPSTSTRRARAWSPWKPP